MQQQGAGGGNFAIVTEIIFKVIPMKNVVTFELEYKFDQIYEFINNWQHWIKDLPNEISTQLSLRGPQYPLWITGQYNYLDDPNPKLTVEKLLTCLIKKTNPKNVNIEI